MLEVLSEVPLQEKEDFLYPERGEISLTLGI